MESQPSRLRLIKELLRLGRNGELRMDELILATRSDEECLDTILKAFEDGGFLHRLGDRILLDREGKIRLLVMGCELGGDVEELGRLIGWMDFEILIQKALEAYGYEVIHAFRFSHGKRRWEVDLLALRNPFILCIDCKHMLRRQGSSLKRGAEHNNVRAKSLGESLESLEEKLSINSWKRALILPIIVSLLAPPFQEYKGCPIVPILKLRNFLSELGGYIDSFRTLSFERDAQGMWRGENLP
jgi:hypothetical protein